jgi:ribonuclease R
MGRKKKKNKGFPKDKAPRISKESLRGELVQVFRSNPGKLMNYKQVSSILNITNSEARKLVLKTLNELSQSDMLLQPSTGKFEIHPSQVALLTGTIDFVKSGAAYVTLDSGGEDVYISQKNTGTALHGDTVEISVIGIKRGKPDGKVVKVISRGAEQYVGVIKITDKHAFVVPTSQKIHTDFYVDLKKIHNAKDGEKVIVKLLDWTDPSRSPFSEVTAVLGKPGVNETEMHAIMAEFGLPVEFPDAVLQAAEKIKIDITKEELKSRRDFRGVPTFTIDPDDAKDFDDALSLQKLDEDTFEVGVHIADVSHFVTPDSIIDKEAQKRATSVYLVDRVVPMLPEVLSNFVCSLRPNEDKLCMSAVFKVDANGKVLDQWFGKTIIHSKKRYTYNDAQEIIEGKPGDFDAEIKQLHDWATKMRKQRMKQGALEFSGVEVKFKLDENGKPIGVFQKVMKEANFLIEEFMLLANRKVAESIGKTKGNKTAKPFVYRIHDLPDGEKLKSFKDFVGRLGYKLQSIVPEKASWALNQLMAEIKDKPEEDIIKQMAIRTMSKAYYDLDNIGHYGLSFEYYTHFTSPIRRYPDLIVHRLVMAYKNGKNPPNTDDLEKKCKHASRMEKVAADAERASIKYKQVEFMLDKVGQNFRGNVSGLTKWGMYVELEHTKIEGMIPLQSMDDDNYRYDEKTNRIIGTRYKEVFEFGDPVNVEVFGADLILKQLDFRLI